MHVAGERDMSIRMTTSTEGKSHEGHCCGANVRFDGVSAAYRRVLWIVIALNGAMFLVEMSAGVFAGSKALQADALDFFADTLTYGLSLAVIGQPIARRARVAVLKGASLALMGLWVLGSTVWEAFVLGVPRAEIMSVVALLALATNLAAVGLLIRYKDGDANVRSVWLCSRNDAIGNVAVFGAAGLVAATGSGWPDVLVAALLAGLFLRSATLILRQALSEMAADRGHRGHTHA